MNPIMKINSLNAKNQVFISKSIGKWYSNLMFFQNCTIYQQVW